MYTLVNSKRWSNKVQFNLLIVHNSTKASPSQSRLIAKLVEISGTVYILTSNNSIIACTHRRHRLRSSCPAHLTAGRAICLGEERGRVSRYGRILAIEIVELVIENGNRWLFIYNRVGFVYLIYWYLIVKMVDVGRLRRCYTMRHGAS